MPLTFPITPAADFVSRESRANGSKLVSVEVIIRDLALIRALPVPPADAEEIDI